MNVLWDYREQLLNGAVTTIWVSILTLFLSTALGLVVAGLANAGGAGHALSRVYVEIFQNIPYLILVFIFYFGLAQVGVRLSAVQAVIVGLTLYSAAYTAEAIDSGIRGVSDGERRAAVATGMDRLTILRAIVLPQAVVYCLPSLTNQWVRVIKNTTVLAVIGGGDLLYEANLGSAQTYQVFAFYGFVAVAYWILIIPLTRVSARAETVRAWRRAQLGLPTQQRTRRTA